MAKYRHRIFEMYELRDEALQSLMSRAGRIPAAAADPDLWTFAHLTISYEAGVIDVQFQEPRAFDGASAGGLREDFVRLAGLLGRDSKVLVDFSGVVSFNATALAALIQFNRTLQIKGSRIALCSLEPAIRESFFATG